jgi:lysozyme
MKTILWVVLCPATRLKSYNLGAGALQRSTLRAKVNRQEHAQAPNEFMRWVYANGKKVAGLIKRRRIEADLYES